MSAPGRMLATAGMLGIALTFAAPDAGGAPRTAATGTVYGGYTSQNAPFTVELSPDRTTLRSLGVYLEGAEGYTFSNVARALPVDPPAMQLGTSVVQAVRLSRTGTFKTTGRGAMRYGEQLGLFTYTVKGKAKRDAMSGTISGKLALSDKTTLQLVKTVQFPALKWMAMSAPRRIFAGRTAWDDPVVAELAGDRRTIEALRVPWATTDGAWWMAERFNGLPLKAGSFAETWESPYKRDDGGTNLFAYTLRAKVAGRTLTGDLAVKVTMSDAAGAATATSEMPTTMFTARSSAR